MPKATWNGATIAEAPESAIEIVENNVYFPVDAVRRIICSRATRTRCAAGRAPRATTTSP